MNVRYRNGFTLIEMIIYIGIAAIVVVAMMRSMLAVIETREKTQVISEVQQNLRFALQHITVTAYNAIEVNTGSTVFGTNSGSLNLNMSGALLDPTLFFLSGSALYKQEGAMAAEELTSPDMRVTQFLLTNLTGTGAPTTVHIQLAGEDSVDGIEQTYADSMSIDTSFTIRK